MLVGLSEWKDTKLFRQKCRQKDLHMCFIEVYSNYFFRKKLAQHSLWGMNYIYYLFVIR